MAKKKKARGGAAIKTFEEPVTAKPKAGPGKKACPTCGTLTGVRSRECPDCHYDFPVKTKQDKAPSTRAMTPKSKSGDAVSALLAANDFASQVGGIDEAISLLEAVKKIKG